MTNEQASQLRSLEGRHVSLATLPVADPVPPVTAGTATKLRTRRSDLPHIDATWASGPLGQLISMTECALPPATIDCGDTVGPPSGTAPGS